MVSMNIILTALVLILTVLFRAIAKHQSRSHPPLPPGPWPLPVIGNLLELSQNAHISFARQARIYGPVISLKLGNILTVIVSSPSTAKEVLQTKDHLSGRHIPNSLRDLDLTDVSLIWLPPNQSWRDLRSIVKLHLFNTQSLDSTQHIRRQKIHELVAYIRQNDGNVVQICRAAFSTVLNLISSTFLSIDMVDIKTDSAQEMKDLMAILLEEAGKPNISDFFPVLAPLDLQGRRRRMTATANVLVDFFDQIIENRLAIKNEEGKRTSPDVLDVLLQLAKKDNSKLTRRMIISLLMDVFIAGSESSSTTLEWAMAELLRWPAHMSRARAEIVELVGLQRRVEESDISKLPFLQAIVKETFRLHPPVPLLVPHKAMVSTEIKGYAVPKNTQVLVNVWAIGRDERIWADPESFAPERFMGGNNIDFRGQHFELIPFGSGQRMCPGMTMGIGMVQFMLASLIQSFEWSLPEGMVPKDMDFSEKLGVTLVMASPLMAVPTTKL